MSKKEETVHDLSSQFKGKANQNVVIITKDEPSSNVDQLEESQRFTSEQPKMEN